MSQGVGHHGKTLGDIWSGDADHDHEQRDREREDAVAERLDPGRPPDACLVTCRWREAPSFSLGARHELERCLAGLCCQDTVEDGSGVSPVLALVCLIGLYLFAPADQQTDEKLRARSAGSPHMCDSL